MHSRLAELWEYLRMTRSGVVASVEDVSPETADQQPDPKAWSVAEVLDHLCRVERGTIILLDRLIRQAKAAGVGPERSTASVLSSLDSFHVVDTPHRAKAPERVAPSPNIPVSESLQKLGQSREELHSLLQEADGLALGEVSFEHPFLGRLNGYQWLLLLGQHEARHTRQIQNTRDRLLRNS